ncbi:hypothetical protein J3458_002735 [Metarhizium acridum]|uniref:uncharacterized protein n=1 Tax=Metarhizium acridum TaxID=92637 RepID=UPI001C6A8F1F|nr:hypothetical protein J3458_002735 [Metarhizium acridum]
MKGHQSQYMPGQRNPIPNAGCKKETPPRLPRARRRVPLRRAVRAVAVHGPLALCKRRPRPRPQQRRVLRAAAAAAAGSGARLPPRSVELLAQVCRHGVRGRHGVFARRDQGLL